MTIHTVTKDGTLIVQKETKLYMGDRGDFLELADAGDSEVENALSVGFNCIAIVIGSEVSFSFSLSCSETGIIDTKKRKMVKVAGRKSTGLVMLSPTIALHSTS